MKKITYFVFILSLMVNAQDEQSSKKGKVLFNVGPEYRITPIYSSPTATVSTPGDFSSFVDVDRQNSGVGLNLCLEYFLGNKWSIGFSNAFRYDFIVSGGSAIEPDFGAAQNKYGLLIDYTLSLNYYFRLFKVGNFFASAGFSRMNTNSDFTSKRSVFDENNELVTVITTNEDFSYWANKFELGYSHTNGILGVGIYMTQNTNYFDRTTNFIIPFVKIGIKLNR